MQEMHNDWCFSLGSGCQICKVLSKAGEQAASKHELSRGRRTKKLVKCGHKILRNIAFEYFGPNNGII
jgi:hypothetical protein